MKAIIFCLVIFGLILFGSCGKTLTNEPDEILIIEKKVNQKYNLTAVFYGENMKYGDNNEFSTKIIKYVVLSDNNSGKEVRYFPTDASTEQAADFYFAEVWSPDNEYLVLPTGKFHGFGIFKAKDILDNVKNNNFVDSISVKGVDSGNYWHDFEKWENDSTFVSGQV